LEKAMGLRKGDDSTDWLILAMVQWQLGNRQEARQWYEKSVARIEQKNLRQGDLDALRMEAGLLLQKPDPMPHILHAFKLLKEKKGAEAEAELEAAIALKPQNYRAQVLIGSLNAQLARWKEAAAAFRLAFDSRRFDPDEVWEWYRCATLSLYVNDVDMYRQSCRKMIQTTQPIESPDARGQTAMVSLLLPDLGSHDPLITKLAEDGTQTSEDQIAFRACILARALVEYRAGQHSAALKWLARLSPKAGGDARDAAAFTIQAMAQHRAGNLDEARVAFGNAALIVENKDPDATRRDVIDGNWPALLQSRLLYREAESLFNASGASPEERKVAEGLKARPPGAKD
jgi:tetratricopeptide (TPR) repeat protein